MRPLGVFAVIGLFLLSGCAVGLGMSVSFGGGSTGAKPASTPGFRTITGEEVWSGVKTVTERVTVEKSGSLKILPGARITFRLPPSAEKEPWLLVKGRIEAGAAGQEKVVLTGEGGGRGEDGQDMISVQEAAGALFANVEFAHAGWAAHVHDTPEAAFRGCVFRANFGGVRFKCDRLEVSSCLFEDNAIGVRAINSKAPVFRGNAFRGNVAGIFLREGVEGAVIRDNSFDNVEYDVKLGEGQTFDVDATGNSWRAAAEGRLEELIFDGLDSQGVGRVLTEVPK